MPVAELEARYRSSRDGPERSHWQIIWLLAQGHPTSKVAEMTGYSAYWIGQLARRYNTAGVVALRDHRHEARPHRPPLLSASTGLDALRAALAGPAPHGDRRNSRNSRTVAVWLSERVGHPVSAVTAWACVQVGLDGPSSAPAPCQDGDRGNQNCLKKTSRTS